MQKGQIALSTGRTIEVKGADTLFKNDKPRHCARKRENSDNKNDERSNGKLFVHVPIVTCKRKAARSDPRGSIVEAINHGTLRSLFDCGLEWRSSPVM